MQCRAAPAPTNAWVKQMAPWTPADWIELMKVMFYGVGAVCVPLATAFIMISAARLQRLGINVDRLEKNTNSISERNQAIAMKLGITEGIAQERASIAANHPNGTSSSPLPVVDERAAAASERTADAAERVADAAEQKPGGR